MENAMEQAQAFLVTYGLKIVIAIIILIVGRIVSNIVRNLVKKALTKNDVDAGLVNFFGNITFAAMMIFTILAALGQLNVQTASFVAVLGAAGFAVGFALQGSLSNFASGVMILTFRPFKVGDFVDAAGVAGTVKDIQLFNTIIHTGDNVKIIVPNGAVYGGTIKNFSANDTRRVDLVIGIGYGSSIDKAMEVINGIIKGDSRVHTEPAPMMAVTELADSSVNIVIRSWVDASNYWPVKFDQTKTIKEEFDKAGIEIPFPQRVVYMNQGD